MINTKILMYLIFSLFSICLSMLILNASTKIIVVFILFITTAIFYFLCTPFLKLTLMATAITFPITAEVMGKEPVSSGTLVIFMTYIWSLSQLKIIDTIRRDRQIFFLLGILSLIPLIGITLEISSHFLGHALRLYINFLSSIMAFFIIIHIFNSKEIRNHKDLYLEKLISVLLFITVTHIFFTLIIFNFPGVVKYFHIFLVNNQETLGARELQGGLYTRGVNIFTGGEEFGELFVLLFPFALYKALTVRNKLYFAVLMFFILGVFLAGTRSSFFIIGCQVVVYFLAAFLSKEYKFKSIRMIIWIIFILFFTFPLYIMYFEILLVRIYGFFDLYANNSDIISLMNRQSVWPEALKITIATISVFGHGTINAYSLGYTKGNFHSLYLTLLWQFGIIGTMLFLAFFTILCKRLIYKINNKKTETFNYFLSIASLISLLGFLLNEVKFEFNRMDSYQQFVWIIFAVFYLNSFSVAKKI